MKPGNVLSKNSFPARFDRGGAAPNLTSSVRNGFVAVAIDNIFEGIGQPGIRVTCSELCVDEIEVGLQSGRLDLGISFLPASRKNMDGENSYRRARRRCAKQSSRRKEERNSCAPRDVPDEA